MSDQGARSDPYVVFNRYLFANIAASITTIFTTMSIRRQPVTKATRPLRNRKLIGLWVVYEGVFFLTLKLWLDQMRSGEAAEAARNARASNRSHEVGERKRAEELLHDQWLESKPGSRDQ